MTSSPKPVSIIITVKDRANILNDLINNLLNLNYLEYEIIIVDDCSTDNTKDLLKEYPIKSISLERSVGSAEARNIGIGEAKNEVIALTDSDCFISRNWLKDLVPFLNEYDVVGGKVKFYDSSEMKFNPFKLKDKIILKKDSAITFLNTSNMIFKKELWNLTGGFLNFRIEDLEFSWRLIRKGFKLIYVPKGLVIHYGKRNPLQNIKKYFQYGKSYSKIAFIHKMSVSFRTEPIFARKSIWDYLKIITYPLILLFTWFICNSLIYNIVLFYSLLLLILCLSIYIISRYLKKIDIFYILYKSSILFSIANYSIIYMLKK
ncbi:MAG: glycosyltransferase [Candidatus Hodarchaeota archaeon]